MQNFNIVNDFPPDKFNLLIPVQSLQDINPIYRIITNVVKISTDLADQEIYKENNAPKINGQDMYALTAKGLKKLSTASNGQIVSSEKVQPKTCLKCLEIVKATQKSPQCGTCPCSANVAFHVVMKFPEMSGGWRIEQATREADFSLMSNAKPGQIAKMKEFAPEQAETKAMSRCIRKALNIKNAYTLQELQKSFICAYPVLNAADGDVKKALIAGAVASSNLLYGTKLELQAPRTEALPAGEIIESDYEVEQVQYEEPQTQQYNYVCANPQCQKSVPNDVAQASIQKYKQPICEECQKLINQGGNNQ